MIINKSKENHSNPTIERKLRLKYFVDKDILVPRFKNGVLGLYAILNFVDYMWFIYI